MECGVEPPHSKGDIMAITIYQLDRHRVVGFAARELRRYLAQMTGAAVEIVAARAYRPELPGIWLGTARFGVAADARADTIRVAARGGHATLSGANPRAVLFAAYRFLEALGCRWLRPGREGERVPAGVDLAAAALDLRETPSAAHRVICIEGSCSMAHVRAMIDYAAKRGFNGYQTQFFNCYTFFDRWYGVERHRRPVRTPFAADRAFRYTARAQREARRRGLLLHTVGHGWTCVPLGLPAEKWAPYEGPVPEASVQYFAEIDGARTLHRRIPLFTQLCYGNPAVQRLVVDGIVQYIEAHPDEAVVHTWLADGGNNHCECPRCRETRPADFHVRMLNAVDAELTRRGLATRLVVCAYVDLLWGPETERILNPDRFVLLFAPITRSYHHSLAETAAAEEPLPPYQRNKLAFPATARGNLRLLQTWDCAFTGERLLFEYYFWRMHHYDPGQLRMARTLWQDVRHLELLGFSGLISAQAQRVCFPTGVSLHILGKTLWDRTADFDALVDDYLADVFPGDGPAVRRYLEQLTAALDHELLDPADNSKPINPAKRRQALQGWDAAPGLVDAFLPVIARGCADPDPVTAAAWRLLRHHAWYAKAFADLYARVYRHDERATAAFTALADELDRRLPELHHVFDTYICKLMCQHALAMEHLPFEERAVPREGAPARRKQGEAVVNF